MADTFSTLVGQLFGALGSIPEGKVPGDDGCELQASTCAMRTASARWDEVNPPKLPAGLCAEASELVLAGEWLADGVVAHAADATSTRTANCAFIIIGR
jgi:hypothetical protein